MPKLNDIKKERRGRAPEVAVRAPHWLTCTWLRTPCGKKQCPVCSVLAREQKKLLAEGVDRSELLDALDDVRYGIAEAFLDVLRVDPKKRQVRAARMGRDPHRFPLYRELDAWHEQLHDVFDEADLQAGFWLESVDAADLDWYTHVLLDYLRRFLEYGAGRGELSPADRYVRSVMIESAKVVSEKVTRLALYDCMQKGSLLLLAGQFAALQKKLTLL